MAGKRRGKGGRKAKAGERFPCGKLKAVYNDRGNDKVVAMQALFRPFQDGKADVWVASSAIGRAWAVGLLDGYGADAAAIRDAGLKFGELHLANYGRGSETSNYGGEDRRGDAGVRDPILIAGVQVPRDRQGVVYRQQCDAIRDAGWASEDAVMALCCDYATRPWEDPPWLSRLINLKRAEKGLSVSGYLPSLDGSDQRMMKLAIEGLLTIVQGTRRAAA